MDEDDIFPVLCPKKTYSKPFKKVTKITTESNNVEKTSKPAGKVYDPGVPLTTKVAMEYLLNGKLKTSVCRYCLKVTVAMSELDQIIQIAGTGVMYKVTIREMIASFYPFKARQEENFPEKICQRCVDRALNAYLFTQQCEQAERALHNCFEDMNDKLNKLDPMDRPKKRGRQKLNPNFNKLYAEHNKVMDYAEPLRNIINLKTESLSNEPDWNEFECKKCWQVLPNLESLLNHEQIHPKYMWYHCRLCGKSFVKHNQLKRHFNQIHVRGKGFSEEVDKTFKCKECGNITENYIQHLQHVEKHKFKSIMKHVIEKKTDQLCLVCLKKSTDLVELDTMVCIHGSCPKLVGDTSLYTVLASTLPGQKSYKYQELHVPHKADIMTITKRKRKHKEIQNVSGIIPGIQFKLSLPKIISKDKFKTDDFYCYVFCEPDTESCIIEPEDHNTATQDSKSTRFFEITDKETMDCNLDYKMLTNVKEEGSFIGNSSSGDVKPGSVKEPAIVMGICNPEIDMLTNDNEPTDMIKSSNVNNEIQVKDRTQIDSLHFNLNVMNVEIKPMKVQSDYSGDEMVIDGKQISGITGNSKVKDNILHSEDTMDVVDCVLENNIIFNEIRTTSNPEDTVLFDEKYPTELIEQNNSQNKSSFEVSKPSMFHFSDPIVLEFDLNPNNLNIQLDTNMVSMFIFSNPDHVGNTTDQELYTIQSIEESDIPVHDITPINVKNFFSWIFTKASNKYNSVKDNVVTDNLTIAIAEPKIKKTACKFCWLFKHLNKCEYCKKPIDTTVKITNNDKHNKEKDTVHDNITKNKIEKPIDTAIFFGGNVEKPTKPMKTERYDKVMKIEKIWQCNVCLTNNNNDRSTCHCCESNKYIENVNVKVTFGNNKTFFRTTHEKENKDESKMEKEVVKSNKEPILFTVIDEASMMDTKSGTMQENIEIQIDSIRDTNSTHSMDIEMDPVTCTLDAVNEEMDVEEEPLVPNTVQMFNPTPTNMFAANVVTYVGTNIQFNIGSKLIQNEKGARKIKRTVRNMPKAIHK